MENKSEQVSDSKDLILTSPEQKLALFLHENPDATPREKAVQIADSVDFSVASADNKKYHKQSVVIILTEVINGLSPTRAGALAFVSDTTLVNWRKLYPDYAFAEKLAESLDIRKSLKTARDGEAENEWKHLSRRYRSEYGEHVEHKHSGQVAQIHLAGDQLKELSSSYQEYLGNHSQVTDAEYTKIEDTNKIEGQ